ncbi:ead/Ea22-like family protein [Enterobacter hormaechei]|uniref:ead/Ea22-like family protein n=1 Tax=Enterobacter hormaechei TaxID=158836 RepID=UPI001D031675|nr:ead/Ea22-like family protein [Enterobacter hormaechei]
MSNINKQELREAAERAESDSWGYDRDEFNEALTPSTVLALLDELEAKDSMIAAQQHEIRTLLNALEGRPCPKCNDTGMADSGGTQPWGEPISVPCDCAAPPAPVSVPDEIPKLKDGRGFKYVKDRVRYSVNYANGWNACRAAMLQGADRPQNETQNIPENIPATQFKPVADLYGLTSPTGSETSFTFDAVEARDFIDGGWSCQEYVELGRFQEAMLQNGNSPAQSDCCPEQNYIAPAQDGDSPVIPDGWVMVPEEPTHEMLEAGDEQFGTYDVYRRMLASAPQQEA